MIVAVVVAVTVAVAVVVAIAFEWLATSAAVTIMLPDCQSALVALSFCKRANLFWLSYECKMFIKLTLVLCRDLLQSETARAQKELG
jgi:hypothetical protein